MKKIILLFILIIGCLTSYSQTISYKDMLFIMNNEETEKIDIHRGLKGVYFDRSAVCFIDGRAGELRYRGYSIHDLAVQSTFEETCYLLMYGELPTKPQLI